MCLPKKVVHKSPSRMSLFFFYYISMNTQLIPQLQRQYHESSREFMGSYEALKGHPASSQEDQLDRVHSDQMVLKMIRWGRLVR